MIAANINQKQTSKQNTNKDLDNIILNTIKSRKNIRKRPDCP